MEVVRTKGIEGEEAAGITGPKTRIPSYSGTAKYRIPDELTPKTVTEVKNVQTLVYSNQIKDFYLYSINHGKQFVLYTRSTTKLSGPLENLVKQGKIIHRIIPGT